MTDRLPAIGQDDWSRYQSELFDEHVNRKIGLLDFDREVDERLATLRPLAQRDPAEDVPEDVARRRDAESDDGWYPIIRDDEWRAHQAALWAAETDKRIAGIGSLGWDLEANDRIDALTAAPPSMPTLPSYAGNEQRDQAGPAGATAAPPAADWATRAEERISSLGGDFLPAGDTTDPNTITAPIAPRPQTFAEFMAAHGVDDRDDGERLGEGDLLPVRPGAIPPAPAGVPPRPPDPFGRVDFGASADTRVGLPDPSAFGATLEAGTPEGGETLSRLSRIAAEQTPGGRLAQGYLGRVVPGTPMNADRPAVENLASLAGMATVPFSIAGDALAAGAQGVLDRVPGGETVPQWARDRGITESTPVLGGLLTPDVAIPAALGMLTPGPDELADLLRALPRYGENVASRVRSQLDEAGGVVPYLERGVATLPTPTAPAGSRPPFRLSEPGIAKRDELIAANVKLGFPEDAAARQVDSYIAALDAAGQVPAPYIASREMFRRLATGRGTPDQAAEVAKRVGDTANRVRYSGMLSNPAGAIVDVASNALNVPLTYNRVIQASVMEGLGERLGKIKPDERSAVLAELDGLNQGLIAGTVDGMRDALRVMVKGGKVVRAEQPPGLVRGPAGLALEFGQRMRVAADVLFSEVGERMAANALGIREAQREGLKYGSGDFRKRAAALSEGIRAALGAGGVEQGGVLSTAGKADAAKIEQLASEALAMAKRGIFQQELGSTAKAVEEVRGTYATRFFVPFYRTAANIASQGLSMTPGVGQAGIAADLVGAKAFGKGAYKAGNAFTTTNTAAVLPASHRLADANLGLMVAATGGALTAAGLMTGGPPKDQTLRRAWYDAGHKPYSLKVGDQEVPIARLVGPLALPLIFGAALADAYRDNGDEADGTMLEDFAANVQASWFDLAGLRAFDDLLGLARGGRIKGELIRTGARQVGSFIPDSALLRAIANAADPKQRAPETFLDFIREGLPVVREQVPAKRNATLRRDVDKPAGQRGPMAFSPIQPVPAADDAAALDEAINRAKRDVVRTLEGSAAYRRMRPDEQKKARAAALSRVSARFTTARRGIAADLLGE